MVEVDHSVALAKGKNRPKRSLHLSNKKIGETKAKVNVDLKINASGRNLPVSKKSKTEQKVVKVPNTVRLKGI